MLHSKLAKAALPAALLSLAVTAYAQGTSGGTSGSSSSMNSAPAKSASKSGSSKGSLDHADRKFLQEAAVGGLAEVEMGQLASQRGESPDVKQFGQRMVQDHGKANDQLKQLASSKGVDIPTETDKSHQKKMAKLEKLQGAAFDKAYMDDMVKDHKKDVKDFQKQSKSAKDPEVKSFAAQTLPTLQEHLQMAESAQKTAKSESKSAKSSKSATNSPMSK